MRWNDDLAAEEPSVRERELSRRHTGDGALEGRRSLVADVALVRPCAHEGSRPWVVGIEVRRLVQVDAAGEVDADMRPAARRVDEVAMPDWVAMPVTNLSTHGSGPNIENVSVKVSEPWNAPAPASDGSAAAASAHAAMRMSFRI